MARITENEWLAELAKLSQRNDEGMTAAEMALANGVSLKTMLGRLAEAKRLGWLTLGHRSAVALNGRPYRTPVYTVAKPKR